MIWIYWAPSEPSVDHEMWKRSYFIWFSEFSLQVGSMLINRVTNTDVTWHQEVTNAAPRVSPIVDLTLDDTSIIRAIDNLNFIQMKRESILSFFWCFLNFVLLFLAVSSCCSTTEFNALSILTQIFSNWSHGNQVFVEISGKETKFCEIHEEKLQTSKV